MIGDEVMNFKLFFQAIIKFLLGIIIVGSLLFIPANTFEYWNGWLFMGILFVPMFIAGIFLMIKNPELLRKRLNAKERENEQKWVLLFSGLMFIAGFIVAGLNYRYKWIELPNIVVIISSILFIWNCKTSHVCSYNCIVFINSINIRFYYFLLHFFNISFYYCKKNKK